VIVYEVNVDVAPDIAEDYGAWLHAHIAEILALPGFTGATRYRREDPASESDAAGPMLRWTIHYRLRDRAALSDYLREHAPRLRAEGVARFGQRFTATRRVLEVAD